ncbi:MAG TPA: hypothetical protein DDX85_01510 [Nitrospiraceae bacterium]|nr:hypothetical protein [Nitrospiraceae bacterium]
MFKLLLPYDSPKSAGWLIPPLAGLCRLSYPGNRMRIPSNKPIHYKEYPLINSIDRREFIYTQIY